MLCSRAPAAIVGGGNSAGQAALFLARYASRVYLIVRASDLDKTMSRYLIDRIKRHPRIDLRLETEVRAAIGGSSLSAVEVEQTSQRSRERLDIRYLFVFIGAAPNTEWLDQITLDEHGFVLTGDEIDSSNVTSWSAMGRTPSHLETSSPGVFAAGDVRSNSVKRVAAAVGEGAMAVYMVHRYLDERGEQFGQLRVPTP
jgi:thioredoxin reductase (NADPH)